MSKLNDYLQQKLESDQEQPFEFGTIEVPGFRRASSFESRRSDKYEYVDQPPHYLIFTPDEVRKLAESGKGIDADMIARQRGLQNDSYMYMVNKYVLRGNKPNEPRMRDVKKIRKYSDMWIEAHAGDPE